MSQEIVEAVRALAREKGISEEKLMGALEAVGGLSFVVLQLLLAHAVLLRLLLLFALLTALYDGKIYGKPAPWALLAGMLGYGAAKARVENATRSGSTDGRPDSHQCARGDRRL